MNECLYCQGELEAQEVERVQDYNGAWYLIQNVPALVCRQCGEIYYTPAAHDLVLKLLQAGHAVRVEPLHVLDAHLT